MSPAPDAFADASLEPGAYPTGFDRQRVRRQGQARRQFAPLFEARTLVVGIVMNDEIAIAGRETHEALFETLEPVVNGAGKVGTRDVRRQLGPESLRAAK